MIGVAFLLFILGKDHKIQSTPDELETSLQKNEPCEASSEVLSSQDTSSEITKTASSKQLNPEDYELITKNLGIVIVNMTNRHASPEKRAAADEMGLFLGEHQTFKSPYPQTYHVKKNSNN